MVIFIVDKNFYSEKHEDYGYKSCKWDKIINDIECKGCYNIFDSKVFVRV